MRLWLKLVTMIIYLLFHVVLKCCLKLLCMLIEWLEMNKVLINFGLVV